jgi:hypothetical protein
LFAKDKLNENVAPLPSPVESLFTARILPPWASTIFFDMYKPRPIPISDFVVNFENNFGNMSGSIPSPLSVILTTTSLLLVSTDADIVPSVVNLIELLSRLSIT